MDTVVEQDIQALELADGCCFSFLIEAVERRRVANTGFAHSRHKPQLEKFMSKKSKSSAVKISRKTEREPCVTKRELPTLASDAIRWFAVRIATQLLFERIKSLLDIFDPS